MRDTDNSPYGVKLGMHIQLRLLKGKQNRGNPSVISIAVVALHGCANDRVLTTCARLGRSSRLSGAGTLPASAYLNLFSG
jgi:hypothetical protein